MTGCGDRQAKGSEALTSRGLAQAGGVELTGATQRRKELSRSCRRLSSTRLLGTSEMGCHRHDFADVAPADLQDEAEELAGAPALVTESEFEFLSRRAMEEARLAQFATTPTAANAHRYLAAAYSEQLARHISVHSELEELLHALP